MERIYYTGVKLVGAALVETGMSLGRHVQNIPFTTRIVILEIHADLYQVLQRMNVFQIHLDRKAYNV